MGALQESLDFSIIVPTYNRPDQLCCCLRALAQLEYPQNRYEVIVVDDGGSAPLLRVVEPFHQQMELKLFHQRNAGPAAARNKGADRARGRFLAFTDDDCRPDPYWLCGLADQLGRTPDRLIGGRTVNALPENPFSSVSQMFIDYLYRYYNAEPGHAQFLASNNMALRARHFYEIGGFDVATARAAGEDRELCSRWLDQGRRMTYSEQAVVYHAHALDLVSFWQQHFNYGRGAQYLHQVNGAKISGGVTPEPVSFYVNLIGYPFSAVSSDDDALTLSFLMAVTQVANAAGFFWEMLVRRCRGR